MGDPALTWAIWAVPSPMLPDDDHARFLDHLGKIHPEVVEAPGLAERRDTWHEHQDSIVAFALGVDMATDPTVDHTTALEYFAASRRYAHLLLWDASTWQCHPWTSPGPGGFITPFRLTRTGQESYWSIRTLEAVGIGKP